MLIFGLQVTLVGIGLVFIALVSLIFVIMGMEKVLMGFNKKPAQKDVAPPRAEATPVVARDPVAVAPAQEDNNELIAVIAAAISAYGGQEVYVKSIRRVRGSAGAPWAQAGRSDYMGMKQTV